MGGGALPFIIRPERRGTNRKRRWPRLRKKANLTGYTDT